MRSSIHCIIPKIKKYSVNFQKIISKVFKLFFCYLASSRDRRSTCKITVRRPFSRAYFCKTTHSGVSAFSRLYIKNFYRSFFCIARIRIITSSQFRFLISCVLRTLHTKISKIRKNKISNA